MIKVETIIAGYGELIVLNEVSLEVGHGGTAIIVGPNGAGKSTLLKVITGLLKPFRGTIYFDGQRIDGKEAYAISDMGISIVPEGGRVFPGLTVYNNLKVGSYSQRGRRHFKERLQEIFSLFPILKDRKGQTAGSLSGGERQMIAIARALMSQPKLILMDEPSMGLAPLVVTEVFGFIKKIKSQGYSILLVEQNLKKAIELADHAYLLESGRLQFHGTKEDFFKNPDIQKAYLGM
jgi:branched-chain amino acid transport system ATP-binding protein